MSSQHTHGDPKPHAWHSCNGLKLARGHLQRAGVGGPSATWRRAQTGRPDPRPSKMRHHPLALP